MTVPTETWVLPRPYPARSSALAKTLAYRDRHPDWRSELSAKKKRRIAEHDEAAA